MLKWTHLPDLRQTRSLGVLERPERINRLAVRCVPGPSTLRANLGQRTSLEQLRQHLLDAAFHLAIARDIPGSDKNRPAYNKRAQPDLIRATDRKEMAIAHHRLNDFLARGIVPGDLKAKAEKATA